MEQVTEDECPQHDFHLQISLRAVNGVSLKLDGSISEENEIEYNPQSIHPVANIYFKLSHRDEYGRPIPQNYQQEVITQLKHRANEMRSLPRLPDQYKSRTFIPHYDPVDLEKGRLCIVPMERFTMSLLTQYNLL